MPVRVEIEGRLVEFDERPTPEDIDFVADRIGLGGGQKPIGFGRQATATALRVGLPLAGATLGPAGVAGGALVGSSLAQAVEGRDISLKELAIDTGISVIPGGRVGARLAGGAVKGARAVGGRLVGGALEGLGIAAAEIGLKEGRLPTLGEGALAAGIGGAAGEFVRRADKRALRQLEVPEGAPARAASGQTPSPERAREVLEEAEIPTVRAQNPEATIPPSPLEPAPGPTGSRFSDDRFERLAARLAPDDLEGQERLRKAFEYTQPDIRARTQRLTDDQAQAMADRLDVPIEPRQPGQAVTQPEVVAIQDAIVKVDGSVSRLTKALAADPDNPALRAELDTAQDHLATLVVNRVSSSSEAGSTLRAFGMSPRGRLAVVESALRQVNKEMPRGQRIAPSRASEFVRRMNEAPDDVSRIQLAQQLRDEVIPRTGTESARSLFFSAVLSRPTTQARNILGNAAQLALVPARSVGAAARAGREARLTGQAPTTTVKSELAGVYSGSLIGLRVGLRRAGEVLSKGITTEQASDVGSLATTISGRSTGQSELASFRPQDVGPARISNVVSRSLEAGDQLFRAINEEIAAHSSAFARASRELGRRANRQTLARRVEDLLGQTEARPGVRGKPVQVPGVGRDLNLADEARKAGARGSFQEKPGALIEGVMLGKRHLAQRSPVAGLVADMIVPFLRTPANLLRRGITVSPFGQVFAELSESKIAAEGLSGIAAQRIRQQVHGEALLGAAMTPLLVYLAQEGGIIGSAPRDPAERSRFFAEGKVPSSVQVGDVNVSSQALGPAALPLTMVSDIVRSFEEGGIGQDDMATRLGAVVAGLGDVTKDQSFLRGISEFLDAFGAAHDDARSQSERFRAFAGQRVSSFVPGIAQDALRAIEAGGDAAVVRDRPKSFGEAVGRALPGLGLPEPPPKIDPTGDVARRSNVIPFVSDIQRTRPEVAQAQDVFRELDRLNAGRKKAPEIGVIEKRAEGKVGGSVPARGTALTFPGGRQIKLGPEDDLTLRQAFTAARIDRVARSIREPGYGRLSDSIRRRRLQGAVRAANEMVRNRARRAVLQKRPLSLEELTD